MLLGAKSFEFEIKNESNRKWYWDETFIVNGLEEDSTPSEMLE